MHEFNWIYSDAELAELCARTATQAAVFLDTEFVRRTTFFAQVGLIQLANTEGNYLIDPQAIDNWQPLADLLSNTSVTKVMHSASEDVDVFYSLLGVKPLPLFDTQIACGIAGLEPGWGFAKMVGHFCGIELDKGETTSDWLQRPLSDRQCQYAVADVVWLAKCYAQLIPMLDQQQRLSWVLEDSARMVNGHVCMQAADTLYKRLKGVGGLNQRQLAMAKYLCEWRDTAAKELDRPKNRVVKDAEIIALIKRQPQQVKEFEALDFGYGWIKRFAQPALDAINKGLAEGEAELPQQEDYERSDKALLTDLKQHVQAEAEALGVADTVLAGKKDLLAQIAAAKQGAGLSEAMAGWRKPIIGQRLADITEAKA